MAVEREAFGVLPDGRPVERVRLVRRAGLEASILTYGATLQALLVPDYEGARDDVLLGHDTLDGYLGERNFFGSTIGRFANRIARGRFVLDGVEHRVPVSDPPNALHGGTAGFDQRLWTVESLGEDDAATFVAMVLDSRDGEEGFPGAVRARVTFALAGEHDLAITMEATTDRTTVIGMTSHGYFNLSGESAGSILDHRLEIAAARYLPIDATSIPKGSPAPVDGTPFDFRTAKPIGRDIRDNHPQLRRAGGFDHCFCLEPDASEPVPAARVHDPSSGRSMVLLTDQPGLQFYSGNALRARAAGKRGRIYRQGDGFCLEPQAWPDAPNRPDFPSARLEPGDIYRHRSIYRFRAEKPELQERS